MSANIEDIVKEYIPKNVCLPVDTSLLYGLIILNQPLDNFGTILLNLWNKAKIRATTDGGTNCLYNFIQSKGKNLNDYIPDFINGDFDSIDQEILEFYRTKGSQIIHTPDQDDTDFTKCLKLLIQQADEKDIKLSHITAVVNTTGRFDHIIGNIQTLYLVQKWTDIPVYLLSHDGLTWLLDKGKHSIKIEEDLMDSPCGLLPIGAACAKITTSGLRWNLSDSRLQFGELVSTSNTYDGSEIVTIQNDTPIIWTMQLSKLLINHSQEFA